MLDDDEDRDEPPDPLLEALAATPEGEVVPRGTVIEGQYRIERVLGEGGMGVVHLARDLRLDREVAIKVGIERSAAAIGRLAREALALARLAHPNVVVIYQVGELDGRVYVAMEYVPGGTARRWCEGKGWREIVALYAAAGDGLAAAHAAGLIHRDFKPDNVLVGADGRPRVADFGLVRVDAKTRDDGAEQHGATGALGTPAYMAPEQFAGGDVDARADQFAFCASLWEALFGERPFAERTTARDGAPRELPRPAPRKIPKHVEAALRKGMAARPDERWERLEPLLAELRRDPARRRIAIAGAGVALAVGAGAVALALGLRGPSEEEACVRGAARIAEAWSPARATEVRANLTPPGTTPAPEVAHTVAAIDAWVARWRGQYRAVCRARRGAWSRALVDRGFACLAERERELSGAVAVLASSRNARARAAELVEQLSTSERCADAAYLTAAVPPPENPLLASAVAAHSEALAKIDALMLVGNVAEARASLEPIAAAADALVYKPLVARVGQTRCQSRMMEDRYAEAFAACHEAYFVARAGRDYGRAAAIAAQAALVLFDQSRDAEAVDWARLADADALTANDPLAEARALRSLAIVMNGRGDAEAALGYAEKLVKLARERGYMLAEALRARADVRTRLGAASGAVDDLDEALRFVEQTYGESSMVVGLELDRATTLLYLDRVPDAVTAARRALAISERIYGAESATTNDIRGTLANTLKEARQFDEALALFDQGITRDEPDSYNLASDLNNRADLAAQMGQLDEALAGWAESARIFRAIVGDDGYEVGMVALNVWNAVDDARRPIAPFAPQTARALAIMAKTPDAPAYGQALIAQGVTELDAGELAPAAEHLALGLAKVGDSWLWRMRAFAAQGRIALARTDLSRARERFGQARAIAHEHGRASLVAELDRLLVSLRANE